LIFWKEEQFMATLSSIGISVPTTVVTEEMPESTRWITGTAFAPTVGRRYEINFGEISYRGEMGFVSAVIRSDGPATAQWYDEGEVRYLDPALRNFIVVAFREIATP
jgi:hypothetical protein